MTTFKKRDIATSITTFTFIIISITGIMMFFHVLDQYTKQMHEILGLLFVLVAVFHIFFNWKAMKNYFKKKTFMFAAVLTLFISSIFIFNSSDKGEHPGHFIINSVVNAPLHQAVSILGKNMEQVNKKLEESGLIIANLSSIKEISEKNNKNTFQIIELISK